MVPTTRTTSELRSRQIARAFDQLQLVVPTLNLGHVQLCLFQLERQLVVLTKGAWERRELHRRVIERYANECLERRAPWGTTRRAIRQLEEAGYTNIDRRVHLAILLGMYALEISPARELGLTRLGDTMWRLRKLRRANRYRRHYERRLAQSLSAINNAA
jgi:hypothetical protein